MRKRGFDSENEEIKLNMTAMIDIVFQLLVFFILTFKVVVMEGDFKVKMPLNTDDQSVIDELPTVIRVQLLAGEDGKISRIIADDDLGSIQEFSSTTMYQDLTGFIEEAISGEGDPTEGSETEVEFDIDYGLEYAYTVQGIESVSGKVNSDGTVKKLISRIKFKDNSAAIE